MGGKTPLTSQVSETYCTFYLARAANFQDGQSQLVTNTCQAHTLPRDAHSTKERCTGKIVGLIDNLSCKISTIPADCFQKYR
jgi:hypothetical protein